MPPTPFGITPATSDQAQLAALRMDLEITPLDKGTRSPTMKSLLQLESASLSKKQPKEKYK
jgi:hypothetical protein